MSVNFNLGTMPPHILEKLTGKSYSVIEHLIKYKDYKSLATFLKSPANATLDSKVFISKAFEELDIKAIAVIANNIPKSDLPNALIELRKLFLSEDTSFKDNQIILKPELKAFCVEAFKIIIEKLEEFSFSTLQIAADFLQQDEFNEIISQNNINLEEEQYKDLDLTHYTIRDQTPLMEINHEIVTSPSIVEVLLSRTYSSVLSKDQVEKTYQNLLSLNNPLITKMMEYTAISILQDKNTLAISFDKKSDSSYDSNTNIVTVNTEISTNFNTLELIFIHELGHYLFQTMFEADGTAVDWQQINPILGSYNNTLPTQTEQILANHKSMYTDLHQSDILPSIIDHLKAEIAFIKTSANMLGCAPFNLSTPIEPLLLDMDRDDLKQHLIYAKFTCPEINLFSEAVPGFSFNETKIQDTIQAGKVVERYDQVVSVYNLYAKCMNYSDITAPLNITSYEETQSYVSDSCIPHIIKINNLDEHDQFFIARVSDWVNRGNGIFDSSSHSYEHERQAELLVRLPEMIAAGIKGNLIEQLEAMQYFWTKYITPKMDEYINSHHENCMSTDANITCIIGHTYIDVDAN